MSKSRSHFKSSKLTNINSGGGPTKEGLVPVATNYIFSGTGALRFHRPPSKPLFTKKKEYCLSGIAVNHAPANTDCRTAEQKAIDNEAAAAAALLARAQDVSQHLPTGVEPADATIDQVITAEAAAVAAALLARVTAVSSQILTLYPNDYSTADDFVNANSELVVTSEQLQAAELLKRAQAVQSEIVFIYGKNFANATLEEVEDAELFKRAKLVAVELGTLYQIENTQNALKNATLEQVIAAESAAAAAAA